MCSKRTILEEIERLIHRDPARRGLISAEAESPPLCRGHLVDAAEHLARYGSQVAIVTGFFVPDNDLPAAETDGPLGAIMLANSLEACGTATQIVTDESCIEALRVAAQAAQFDVDRVQVCPRESASWREEYFRHGFGRNLSHLIAIERVGPSHTEESFLRQAADTGPRDLEQFRRLVPVESRDRCHNMRGHIIDDYTGDLHRLFEDLPKYCPSAKTIGIGDGGNEIGMGRILWEDLVNRFDGEFSGRIPCRIGTDWTIVAGTSNWGGHALAAATLVLKEQQDLLRSWTSLREYAVLQRLVRDGPAIDGATRRQEPTVDGLPFTTYIQPWEGIRSLLGLDD